MESGPLRSGPFSRSTPTFFGHGRFSILVQALLLILFITSSSIAQAQPQIKDQIKDQIKGQTPLLPLRPVIQPSPGQDEPSPPLESGLRLTMSQAIETAKKRYPTIPKTASETLRARAEISVARTEYLPRMDMLYQELRASQNVTEGTILPQFLNVLPIQSGAPARNSSFASKFGSNAGVNFSWELVDFGRRAANVNVARRVVAMAQAQQNLTELDVTSRAAHNYLSLLSAQQQIAAAQATLERMLQWSMVVHTLCDKGLRPGVDAFRADAEVSLARISLIDARKRAELAQQDLSEAIGRAGENIEAVPGPFVTRRSAVPVFKADLSVLENHPLAVLKLRDIDVSRARLHLLDRTWYPHLWFESGIWGRGSGKSEFIKPIAGGIVPKTANWAVGFTLQFPVMQYFKVRADKAMERSQIDMRRSSYDLAMQELIREDAKARILLNRTQDVAAETNTLVVAARENEIKAKERYRVGLTNVVEVAEAEQILARAEMEDAVAQINVWQAQLACAYAHGDLRPFMKLVALAEQ